jgi:hypothetical protein
MTFRDEVEAALASRRAVSGEVEAEEIAGFVVPRRYLPVRAWSGPTPFSGPLDCRKQGSILVGPDGGMWCVEAEVVRLLRSHWRAGWVQGFPCGRMTWGAWQWPRPLVPANVASVNDRVQAARGKGRTFGGHPDLAVTDGRRVVYVECKMKDAIKPSQVEWFEAAFSGGFVDPSQVFVLQGVA